MMQFTSCNLIKCNRREHIECNIFQLKWEGLDVEIFWYMRIKKWWWNEICIQIESFRIIIPVSLSLSRFNPFYPGAEKISRSLSCSLLSKYLNLKKNPRIHIIIFCYHQHFLLHYFFTFSISHSLPHNFFLFSSSFIPIKEKSWIFFISSTLSHISWTINTYSWIYIYSLSF